MNAVGDVIGHKGKYSVELHLPEDSTLSSSDIDTILQASSWDTHPSKVATGYEGGRGILIPKEHTVHKNGMPLAGLYISGIGMRAMKQVDKNTVTISENFRPPNNSDFLTDSMPMITNEIVDGKIEQNRPIYRASGTYTALELKAKIEGTRKADTLGLSKMTVQNIEAYGY